MPLVLSLIYDLSSAHVAGEPDIRRLHPPAVVSEVTWSVAHRDLVLFADHKAILERVVGLHKAYW